MLIICNFNLFRLSTSPKIGYLFHKQKDFIIKVILVISTDIFNEK